jgi:pimeloyl-ACP methyl ester carboxylesterase
MAAVFVMPPQEPAALASPNDPVAWGTGCSSSRLGLDNVVVQLAPALTTKPDTNPDGTPVKITPNRRGRYVPVIMVHGWIGKDTHVDARDGAFSHLIDLTTNRLGQVATTRSLIGQLQRIPGAAVFTFDYRDYAARWIDDERLGPGLGKVIDCLYRASGEKVIIIGHSMGGLLARYAATHPGVTGADRSGEISTVITFGTPETGSIAAQVLATAVDSNASAVTRLILSACGQLASATAVRTGTLCDTLPPPARTFYSNAGLALRAGSPQLAALKPFPKPITVNALAGGATFHLKDPGWFSLPWATTNVDVGDLIVTTRSALHGATQTKKASCAYQLSPVRGATDSIGLVFGLVSKVDVAEQPLASLTGACFHTNLMRAIQLTNEATGAINDDLGSRQPVTATDLLSAPVPAYCRHKAGVLRNGRLPGIPPGQGEMGLPWKLWSDPARQGDLLVLGDLTGDGVGDAAAVLYCNAGGVSWPEMVSFYTHGPTLLGTVFLSDVNLPGHEPGQNDLVHKLRYHNGAVTVEWTTQQKGDPAANGTLDYSATLRWNGRKIVVSGLTGTTEQHTVDQFMSHVARGELPAANQLAAPGVVANTSNQLRSYPAAARAQASCYGRIDFDLPAAVASNPEIANDTTADRLCLLSTRSSPMAWIVLGVHHTGFRQWRVEWSRPS